MILLADFKGSCNCQLSPSLNLRMIFEDDLFDESSNDVLKQHLQVYQDSIPFDFDKNLSELIRGFPKLCEEVKSQIPIREEFKQNAMQGNFSRALFESRVKDLAEGFSLKSGVFTSDGGSRHIKISTNASVVTIHSIGDREGEKSRYAEYKKRLSRSNPSANSIHYNLQGNLFIDDDIGQPEIAINPFNDPRLYFTICVPRFAHTRKDSYLILPSFNYSSKAIFEFDYYRIRETFETEQPFSVYTENDITPGLISLKNDDINIIFPKPLENDEVEEDGDE
jgi:hypothetical protein